jgi:hypothetical protein
MMPDVFYIFVVVVFVFLAGWFLFVTPKEIMFLLVSIAVWGYALAQLPEFVAFAHEHWIAAILIWLGISTVTWFGIMAAAVIGLGMQIGPKEIKEPEPTSAPAPVLQAKKPVAKSRANVQPGKGPTFDEWRRKVMAERIDK